MMDAIFEFWLMMQLRKPRHAFRRCATRVIFCVNFDVRLMAYASTGSSGVLYVNANLSPTLIRTRLSSVETSPLSREYVNSLVVCVQCLYERCAIQHSDKSYLAHYTCRYF